MVAAARITFRMPEDVRAFLAAEAARNCTSQNAELIRSVRERMTRTDDLGPRRTAIAAQTMPSGQSPSEGERNTCRGHEQP